MIQMRALRKIKRAGGACPEMSIMKLHSEKAVLLLRVALGVLILLNMLMIFLFSAQSGEESGETSGRVVRFLAEALVPGYEKMSAAEQATVIEAMHGPVRKAAHMGEFGLLGIWILLLLLTYPGRILPRYLGAVGTTMLYAVSDEIHQAFSVGRGPGVGDVLIDTLGASIACALLLLLRLCILTIKSRKENLSCN